MPSSVLPVSSVGGMAPVVQRSFNDNAVNDNAVNNNAVNNNAVLSLGEAAMRAATVVPTLGAIPRVTRSAASVHTPRPLPAPRASGGSPTSSSSSGSVMRRSTSSPSAGNSGGSAAQAAQTSSGSSRTPRAVKPKVIARRPQSSAAVRRETETVSRSASLPAGTSSAEATTDRLDGLDQILDALEARVLRALERRGGVHRGWF
jgi:hypothetical protein